MCNALAAGYFVNAARRSANSDGIFYSLPLFESSSGSGSASALKATDNSYSYDNNEKLVLHLHSSSVLTQCTSQACYAAGCWPKQPEYVIYQVRLHYQHCFVLFCSVPIYFCFWLHCGIVCCGVVYCTNSYITHIFILFSLEALLLFH